MLESYGRLSHAGDPANYVREIEGGALERSCPLCDAEPLQQFPHWKIVRNIYPYDKIAKKHDMLVPLRHAREAELTVEESAELDQIKETYVHENYEYMIEATHKRKSIPAHFHLHLIDAL